MQLSRFCHSAAGLEARSREGEQIIGSEADRHRNYLNAGSLEDICMVLTLHPIL